MPKKDNNSILCYLHVHVQVDRAKWLLSSLLYSGIDSLDLIDGALGLLVCNLIATT